MTPTLLLTRPEEQSREIAAAVAGVRCVIAPVMEIVASGAPFEPAGYAGVILTSGNGAAMAPDLTNIRVYCVGKRTAQAARERGAEVVLIADDANDLVDRFAGTGPIVHLRGEHARGDIANRLSSAGIETDEIIVYRQEPRPLSAEAKALIEGDGRVVLPLYSPRSAQHVAGAIGRVGRQVKAIAISPAVAEAWAAGGGAMEICTTPTGEEMLRRIRAACEADSP